ncbi:MAG: exosortase family protein XrtF [Cytophagaceae bacterium]|nr:exosortase family protein XrtF [Cytophagaceae bacterium]
MFKDKKLLRFLLICTALYIVWFLLYELWLKPNGKLDFMLTHMVSSHTVSVLQLLGYPLSHEIEGVRHIVKGPEGKVLIISNACNGLILYPLFIGFILAIPGRIKAMCWMILVGSVGIYLVNIFRAVLLCLIKMKFPEYLDFNHRYTFTIIVYGFIFCLWILWINKFSHIKRRASQ